MEASNCIRPEELPAKEGIARNGSNRVRGTKARKNLKKDLKQSSQKKASTDEAVPQKKEPTHELGPGTAADKKPVEATTSRHRERDQPPRPTGIRPTHS